MPIAAFVLSAAALAPWPPADEMRPLWSYRIVTTVSVHADGRVTPCDSQFVAPEAEVPRVDACPAYRTWPFASVAKLPARIRFLEEQVVDGRPPLPELPARGFAVAVEQVTRFTVDAAGDVTRCEVIREDAASSEPACGKKPHFMAPESAPVMVRSRRVIATAAPLAR